MSSENLAHLHFQHQQQQQQQQPHSQQGNQLTNDLYKMLNIFSQSNAQTKEIEETFKYFEQNFPKQANLISIVVDFYLSQSSPLVECSFVSNQLSNRTLIDLICRIQDELCIKLFDKLNDSLKQIQVQQQQQIQQMQQYQTQQFDFSSTIQSNKNLVRSFEKLTNLIVLICYKKRSWLSKFSSHSLFNNLVKMLKNNFNLTELITVHVSLIFVVLINTIPLQMLNQHAEDVFQSFINLFKFLSTLEQQKLYNDDIAWRNLKWSIRLFFYVCYGLYANQFIQYLRKKDPNLLNKEFLTSTFYYLRLHPSLFKEKVDTEKQFKQLTSDLDVSLEWRRYCLDPLCTNFNEVVQIISNPSSKTSSMQLQPQSNRLSFMGSSSSSLSSSSQQSRFVNQPVQLPSTTTYNPFHSPMSHLNESTFIAPASPSYLFASHQSKPNHPELAKKTSQTSVPTTPIPPYNSSIFQYPPLASNLTHSPLTQQSADLSKGQPMTNVINNNSIINLTDHFMMSENVVNSNMNINELINEETSLSKSRKNSSNLFKKSRFKEQGSFEPTTSLKKSMSDPNLSLDHNLSHQFNNDSINWKELRDELLNDNKTTSTADSANITNQTMRILNQNNLNLNHSLNLKSNANRNKMVKSEMRDATIKDPNDCYLSALLQQQAFGNDFCSSSNIFDESFPLRSSSLNLLSQNATKLGFFESNDLISAHFANLNNQPTTDLQQNSSSNTQSSSSLNSSNSHSNSSFVISKLKQDMNHLVIQLMYERHLRDKFEETANRLHFIKIERDQLLLEKANADKNLRHLLEKYNNEVEESLNMRNKIEMDSFKCVLNEKTQMIDYLKKKLELVEQNMEKQNENYEQMSAQNVRLHSELSAALQTLEREQNLKIKSEIDNNYVKSLRFSADLLRKQLLVMSKNQQDLVNICNKEFKELALINHAQSSLVSYGDLNLSDLSQTHTSMEPEFNPMSSLYKHQQNIIEMQQEEIERLNRVYNELLAKHNDMAIELDTYKQNLKLKEMNVEELNQTLSMEVIGLKGELIKNHTRVQSSLMNVNKRLEEEIRQLRAVVKEQELKLANQTKQSDEQNKWHAFLIEEAKARFK